jgi:hypothetical protein
MIVDDIEAKKIFNFIQNEDSKNLLAHLRYLSNS